MKEILIETKNIQFAYNEKDVLKGIDLSICKGEKIAVMGRNGAGKTTFLLNINGVLSPDKGKIYVKGKEIGKCNADVLRKTTGFVFQDPDSQIIASTVKAEISFGPLNMGLEKNEVKKRVDSAIEYMGLKGFENRAPHYLSGGEKKRVTIADILAMGPEVFIFDEPMSSLDPINAENVESIINRLHNEGKTLIVSTHNSDFAYRFAERIIVFDDGKIAGDGTPDEIFSNVELLEKTDLKKPEIMIIWEKLARKGIVKGNCPKTAEETAMAIIACI